MYYVKSKGDTPRALEQFLADSAPHGVVKKMRTDNGGEYVSQVFKGILVENKIKLETSSPYSPHQNGTAERGWRTVFNMARCLLSESKLPKSFWTYAVMTSVYVKNRCYSQRTKQTPYYMINGREPDVSKMHVFGTTCYAYQQTQKKKLDDRCKKGIFLGYDKGSPAYLVYFPESQKVMKHRCVKFTEEFPKDNMVNNESTCSDQIGDEDFPGNIYSDVLVHAVPVDEETEGESVNVEPVPKVVTVEHAPEEITEDADETVPYDIEANDFRYPRREHRPPPHLNEYVSNDQAYNVDFCYGVNVVNAIST